jgi:hypothetical protein
MAYYERRGTFSITRKLEWGLGKLHWMYSRAHGGTAELKDFLPYSAADEKELSVNDFINWN